LTTFTSTAPNDSRRADVRPLLPRRVRLSTPTFVPHLAAAAATNSPTYPARHGARRHHVELTQLAPYCTVFGAPHDGYGEPQFGHRLPQEVGPSEQRVRRASPAAPGARARAEFREAGTAAHIGDSLAVADQFCTAAQFKRCRSQSRPTSRGPMRPRSTPGRGISAYRQACSSRAPKTRRRPAAGSAAWTVSRETSLDDRGTGVVASLKRPRPPRRSRSFAVFHVKHPPNPRPGGRVGTTRCNSGRRYPRRARRRDGTARPLALAPNAVDAATASCTIFRSNGVMGANSSRSPLPAPGGDLLAKGRQLVAAATAPARDVQHEPAALPRLLMNREPRQLLERVEHSPLRPTNLVRSSPRRCDDRAIALDVEIDIAVEVKEVQELFEVVAAISPSATKALLKSAFFGAGGSTPSVAWTPRRRRSRCARRVGVSHVRPLFSFIGRPRNHRGPHWGSGCEAPSSLRFFGRLSGAAHSSGHRCGCRRSCLAAPCRSGERHQHP